MDPFVLWDDLPSRREIILTKWKAFKRRRKGTQEDRVIKFVDELLADPEVVSQVVSAARRKGREAGFVEAAGIMGALLETGEKPTDMDSAKMATASTSDRISEFLPLRWKPISEVPTRVSSSARATAATSSGWAGATERNAAIASMP